MVIGLDDVGLMLVFERQAERERHPFDRRELAVERAVTFRIAGNFVKDNRRGLALAALGKHLRDRAHLAIPVSAVDFEQLTDLFHLIDPITQTAIGYRAL